MVTNRSDTTSYRHHRHCGRRHWQRLAAFVGIGLGLGLGSCSKEPGTSVVDGAETLSVGVAVVPSTAVNKGWGETKAIIDGTAFPEAEKAEIGVYVWKKGADWTSSVGTAYSATVVKDLNQPFTKEAGSTEWTTTLKTKLDATEGYAFAVYPYDKGGYGGGVGKPADGYISFNFPSTGAVDVVDYMVSEPVEVDVLRRKADFKMRHILSQVSFKIYKDQASYKGGVGLLTQVQFKAKVGVTNGWILSRQELDNGIAYNFRTKEYSLGSSAPLAEGVIRPGNLTLPASLPSTSNWRQLMIPMAWDNAPAPVPGDGDVEALFTIDGDVYTVPIPSVTWSEGVNYVYTLKLSGRVLTLEGVVTDDMIDGGSSDVTAVEGISFTDDPAHSLFLVGLKAMMTESPGMLQWQTTSSTVPGVVDSWNGKANTAVLAALAAPNDSPAGKFCYDLDAKGRTYYLPAQHQLLMCWVFKEVIPASEAFSPTQTQYWSSTEDYDNSALAPAVTMSNGNHNATIKEISMKVRCVRDL